MPIYEYRCPQCGRVIEILERGTKDVVPACPDCSNTNLERLISTPYLVRRESAPSGKTCCGREERCETSPCSTGGGCHRE